MTEAVIPSRPVAAKRDLLDMTALIRSIQRAEGNPDCFLKGGDDCAQLACSWRLYCLGRENTF
ncbi:MAG: SAP domain-containing protein [Deltaproteobacteria bacterium]|nr:SAP domain-containing protein [Deltaproteobacteria bacterium]